MSITVENNLKNTNKTDLLSQQTHYIPCKIETDGPANVEQYFEPYLEKNKDGDLSASFRGHPLDGVNMELPEGYRAIICSESKRPLNEEADRKFQVVGGFKEFTYWNWDKKPSKNDNLVKALDWIDISKAIHED